MLFGQSVFQSVLTRLDEEAKEEDTSVGASGFRVTGLNSGFVSATEDATGFGHVGVSEAYMGLLGDAPPPPQPEPPIDAPPEEPQIPEQLLRLSEADIAADLALSPDETAETLAEKRRRFAKDNHPDLVPEIFRDNATLRMKTANGLIDRALGDLYWRSS
jgi:hypothetical protein